MDPDLAELESLFPVFVAESEPHLARLEEALLILERDPGDAQDLSTALRAMHTLKGSAGMLGLDAISEVAHAGEDIFAALKEGELRVTRPLVSLLLDATDAIATMVARVEERDLPKPGGHDALIRRLVSALEGGDESPVSEVASPDPDPEPEPTTDDGLGSRQAPLLTTADPPLEAPPSSGSRGARSTLRVDVARLDHLVDLVHQLALERRMLLSKAAALAPAHQTTLRDLVEEGDRVVEDLRDTLMALRLVPMGPTLRRFVRAVRDMAAATGKHARLVIEGEDVQVDTSVAEALVEPLTHLVRNAVDHGIEPAADRVAGGKPPTGTVTLRASRDAAGVLVEVEDDGGGLRRAKLVQRAHEWQVPGADELGESELRALIFEPGFSTAEAVSDLSGRGVGMDIVRRQVENLRGSVSIRSLEGRGTAVGLSVPLTVTTIEGLRVQVGEGRYIVPLASVRACVDAPPGQAAEGVVEMGGQALPYARLRPLFGVSAPPPAREDMLVVQNGAVSAGLVVDELQGAVETMVRPLDPRLRSRMSGSAVLDDGSIGLVLDVAGILQRLTGQNARPVEAVDPPA
jgi:two-component system chemotaxis sensor kinase CheA